MTELNIKNFQVGTLETNCYIVWDSNFINEAVIIDPGADSDILLKFIKNNNLKIKYIINTHGHADHIAMNNELKNVFNDSKILINENDAEYLSDPEKNLSTWIDLKITSYHADAYLKESDIIKFADNKHSFKIIETPGHTKGCVCLLLDNKYLFSGDTLFNGSIGRTDLPGSSSKQILESLKKLKVLDKNIIVYPGHGKFSTIESELKNNFFLQKEIPMY